MPVGSYGRLVFLGSSFLVVCLALELAALKSLSGPIARRFRDCARIDSIFCGRFFRADFFRLEFFGFCLVCRFFWAGLFFMFLGCAWLVDCPGFIASRSDCVLSFTRETRGFVHGKCLYAAKNFRAADLHFPYTRGSGTKARPSCLITRGCFPFSRIKAVWDE